MMLSVNFDRQKI